MKPEFTPNGIEVQTYQEIYDELAAGYRAIYGEDINLDPDSPDGQRVGIEARARLDLQSYGLALYQQLDPDFSIGVALDRLIKLSGIVRRPPARSQVDVTITTDRPLVLPDDYQVEDDLGQVWVTLDEVVLANGANTVTLFSQEFGAVEADADTITEPVTVVIGVQSVTNDAAAQVGRDEETDEELRRRRDRSLENPGYSTRGQLYAALGNLPGVTDLQVHENDTNTTDTDLDLGPHAIWAVVEGGAVDDIIESLAKNKTQGTDIKGTITGSYVETLFKPDGSEYFIVHAMQFDRPEYVAMQVRMNATRRDASTPIDTVLIEQEIAKRSYEIGQNALASELYYNAYQAGDSFIATDLEISLDGVTWTDERIEAGPQDKIRIDAADVTVTEIIP